VIGLLLLAAHGQLEEQIELMNRRILEAPDVARHRLRRGELLRLHGETHAAAEASRAWELAEADFAKGLELDPGLRAIHVALGRLRLAAGRPAAALAPLERFLEDEPDHAEARLYLARALAGVGRREEAAAAYARSLERTSAPAPDVYLERADLLETAGRREDALRGLEEGLDRLGPVVTLDLKALEIEAALGRHEAALARVDRWLARPGRREEWQVRRAEILARLGRNAEARASADAALASLAALPPGRREVPAARALEGRARALAK
jgi:tetratricopeptide (TPR) repeat protein